MICTYLREVLSRASWVWFFSQSALYHQNKGLIYLLFSLVAMLRSYTWIAWFNFVYLLHDHSRIKVGSCISWNIPTELLQRIKLKKCCCVVCTLYICTLDLAQLCSALAQNQPVFVQILLKFLVYKQVNQVVTNTKNRTIYKTEWVHWQIVQLHTQQIWGLSHAAFPFGEAIDHSWVMCLEIEVLLWGISLESQWKYRIYTICNITWFLSAMFTFTTT